VVRGVSVPCTARALASVLVRRSMIVSRAGALGELASAVVETSSISLCPISLKMGGRVRRCETRLTGVVG